MSLLDDGFVDEHHGNVFFDAIDAFAGRALERGTVFHERHRRLAVRTCKNFEKLGIDRHAANYMTPPRFCGTIH